MPRELDTLIIVPGHASFLETVQLPLSADFVDDKNWALAPFQTGEPPYYVEHIVNGIDQADESSLLVFSGGRTSKASGRVWSEAKTYDEIAKTNSLYPVGRVALEESARDSFQNVEYSLELFRKRYKKDSKVIKMVGWLFKKERFEFHAQTLGITPDTFMYVGVNNPENVTNALAGEQRTLRAFREFPRGDGVSLLLKRRTRDPFDDDIR